MLNQDEPQLPYRIVAEGKLTKETDFTIHQRPKFSHLSNSLFNVKDLIFMLENFLPLVECPDKTAYPTIDVITLQSYCILDYGNIYAKEVTLKIEHQDALTQSIPTLEAALKLFTHTYTPNIEIIHVEWAPRGSMNHDSRVIKVVLQIFPVKVIQTQNIDTLTCMVNVDRVEDEQATHYTQGDLTLSTALLHKFACKIADRDFNYWCSYIHGLTVVNPCAVVGEELPFRAGDSGVTPMGRFTFELHVRFTPVAMPDRPPVEAYTLEEIAGALKTNIQRCFNQDPLSLNKNSANTWEVISVKPYDADPSLFAIIFSGTL